MTWARALAWGDALSIRSGRSVPAGGGAMHTVALIGYVVTIATHPERDRLTLPPTVGLPSLHQQPAAEGRGGEAHAAEGRLMQQRAGEGRLMQQRAGEGRLMQLCMSW